MTVKLSRKLNVVVYRYLDMHFSLQAIDNFHIDNKLIFHIHTTVLLLVWNMSGTTRVSRYQKG